MSYLVSRVGTKTGRKGLGWTAIFVMAFVRVGLCSGAQVVVEPTLVGTFFTEKVDFSARLHPQYDNLESRLSGTAVSDPVASKRLFFRRVFVGVKVDLSKQFRLNYLTDISDYVVKNQVTRLEWKANDSDQFYFGYQKVPFGFEDTLSSAKVKPIERSANTRFWNEVVGIGSYHSGIFYSRNYGKGRSSTFGLTHNLKGESDWPNLLSGISSFYARLSQKGKFGDGSIYHYGLDLAYQPYGDGREIVAASGVTGFSIAKYDCALEATAGKIDLESGTTSNAFGWHAQVSRGFSKRFEWVARLSRVDTDGYALKLSSAIRKAPYSGFKYGNVDSLYLGVNYFIKGEDLKLSVGYELADGRNALSGVGPLESVRETVSGFRVRGQLMF